MLSSCNSRTLLSHALLMLWSPIAARSSPEHSVPDVTALTQVGGLVRCHVRRVTLNGPSCSEFNTPPVVSREDWG